MENSILFDYDIISNILLYLSYDDIISYCNSNKIAINIYKDHFFWVKKTLKYLGVPEDLFDKTNLQPNLRYLQLASILKKDVSIKSLDYINMDQFVKISIKNKKWGLLKYALKNNYDNFQLILRKVSKIGNLYYMDLFLNKSKNYQAAAFGSIKGKNTKLFRELYLNAPEDYIWNYNELVTAALEIGDINLFEYLFEDAPKFYNWRYMNIFSKLHMKPTLFEYIMEFIIKYQNSELISAGYKLFIKAKRIDLIEQLRSLDSSDVSDLMMMCENNINILNYLLSMKDDEDVDMCIIMSNNIKFYDEIKTLIPKDDCLDWEIWAYSAIRSLDIVIFNKILADAPNDYEWAWEFILSAILSEPIPKMAMIADEDIHLFNYIFGLVPKSYLWNWSDLASSAIINTNDKLFWHIMSIAPKDYEWDWNSILYAGLESSSVDVIKHILPNIPKEYPLWPNQLALSSSINKNLFVRIVSTLKDNDLNLQELIRDMVRNCPDSYTRYETFEYILSNNNFTLDNYKHFLSRVSDIHILNLIGKFIPKNLNWDELIMNLKVKRKSDLYSSYICSIKNLSSGNDLNNLINNNNNNRVIYFEQNKFLKNRPTPPECLYITFYIDKFYTILINTSILEKYKNSHSILKEVKFG